MSLCHHDYMMNYRILCWMAHEGEVGHNLLNDCRHKIYKVSRNLVIWIFQHLPTTTNLGHVWIGSTPLKSRERAELGLGHSRNLAYKFVCSRSLSVEWRGFKWVLSLL
jgi:hypothetical protein